MRLIELGIATALVCGCTASPKTSDTPAMVSRVIARSGPFILEAQDANTTSSLRGLSVVNDRVVWASGAAGTVIRTVDGGVTWTSHPITTAARLDLRDIHAFSESTAIAMATAGRLFRTSDGGRSWAEVYASADTSAFLDAISFWDSTHGIVLGDPLGGAFLILLSDDGGATWRELPKPESPRALEGEAAFAASGTALAVAGSHHAWFGTGGAGHARVFRSTDRGRTWSSAITPVTAGNASSGIFSVTFTDTLNGTVAGGDYRQPTGASANLAFTTDGGRTFTLHLQRPPQYLSSIAIHARPRSTIMAAGIAGIVYASHDTTLGWTTLHAGEWNSLAMGTGRAWVAGPGGRVARVRF